MLDIFSTKSHFDSEKTIQKGSAEYYTGRLSIQEHYELAMSDWVVDRNLSAVAFFLCAVMAIWMFTKFLWIFMMTFIVGVVFFGWAALKIHRYIESEREKDRVTK